MFDAALTISSLVTLAGLTIQAVALVRAMKAVSRQ